MARATPGSVVTSDDLTNGVAGSYAKTLSLATLAKVGRNTAASWTQTGHLIGRTTKIRTAVDTHPAAIAFAAYLGHLDGERALRVLATRSSAVLDVHREGILDALRRAHVAGLLDLRTAGHVTEIGFSYLESDAR